jgi:hypothetical protein
MRNDQYTKLPSTKSLSMLSMQPLNTRHASKSWSAVYSAQRHKGGARRAGDSRAAEYAVGLLPYKTKISVGHTQDKCLIS